MDELMSFIIQERIAYFYSERKKEKPEELETERDWLDKWEEFLERCSPEVAEMSRNYINWLLEQQGREIEDCYLFGVEDGIRLMKGVRGLLEF